MLSTVSLVSLLVLFLCDLSGVVLSRSVLEEEPAITTYKLPDSDCPGEEVTLLGSNLPKTASPSYLQCRFVFDIPGLAPATSRAKPVDHKGNITEARCPLPNAPGHVQSLQVWLMTQNGTSKILHKFTTSFDIREEGSRKCGSRGGNTLPYWAWYVAGGGAVFLAAVLLAVGIYLFNRAAQQRRRLARLGAESAALLDSDI